MCIQRLVICVQRLEGNIAHELIGIRLDFSWMQTCIVKKKYCMEMRNLDVLSRDWVSGYSEARRLLRAEISAILAIIRQSYSPRP